MLSLSGAVQRPWRDVLLKHSPGRQVSRLLNVVVVVLVICAATTCAAPAAADRRDNYTGRLFAHHAHERVGPTPTAATTATALAYAPTAAHLSCSHHFVAHSHRRGGAETPLVEHVSRIRDDVRIRTCA
ncbi:hypothetical protein BV20DRAFT_966413 [Pilatotrama ljubarskyi]|nr:hypothetical protein BV20DRAFT_966413 [Pilatotrama ljubarskyi]